MAAKLHSYLAAAWYEAPDESRPLLDPALRELSTRTGETRCDSVLDVDGGIAVLFVYGSKCAEELPEGQVLPDGDTEPLHHMQRTAVQGPPDTLAMLTEHRPGTPAQAE